jgi:pyruvate formate lyase activating enzyme
MALKIKSNIIVSGFEPYTLNDYPGKPASVLFIAGCNLRCRFCHNPELVLNSGLKNRFEESMNFIDENNIKNVVITGGEPLFSPFIFDLLEFLKSRNMSIKLDTNGFLPAKLEYVVKHRLADFIAMDIKGLNDHDIVKITRKDVRLSISLKSIDILNKSGISYELRYTEWKRYTELEWKQFYKISQTTCKVKIQKLRTDFKMLDKSFEPELKTF